MTNEEHIKKLKDILSEATETEDAVCYVTSEDKETLEAAISALSQPQVSESAYKQEPCEDAISREWLKIAIHNFYYGLKHTPTEEDIQSYIDAAPPVNPQPKTGHWIDDEFGSKCSCCGIHTHLDKFDRPMKFKCCSMCGAKMVEPQESEG